MTFRSLAAIVALIATLPVAAAADTPTVQSDPSRPVLTKVRVENADAARWKEMLALRNDRHDTAYTRSSPAHAERTEPTHQGRGGPFASKPFYRPSVVVPGPALGL